MVVVYKLKTEDYSRYHYRLWNPATKRWLHLSATGETDNINWAWKGTIAQMRVLAERAGTRGDPWPYERDDRE